jgi:hypothetical protein
MMNPKLIYILKATIIIYCICHLVYYVYINFPVERKMCDTSFFLERDFPVQTNQNGPVSPSIYTQPTISINKDLLYDLHIPSLYGIDPVQMGMDAETLWKLREIIKLRKKGEFLPAPFLPAKYFTKQLSGYPNHWMDLTCKGKHFDELSDKLKLFVERYAHKEEGGNDAFKDLFSIRTPDSEIYLCSIHAHHVQLTKDENMNYINQWLKSLGVPQQIHTYPSKTYGLQWIHNLVLYELRFSHDTDKDQFTIHINITLSTYDTSNGPSDSKQPVSIDIIEEDSVEYTLIKEKLFDGLGVVLLE